MKIIECPRDAMQGMHEFVPTELKIKYLQTLLEVGFNTLDFGSFVSPKAVPQMKDTAEVLAGLDCDNSDTQLLAIVANMRGVHDALRHTEIQYVGFPFSISETFQIKNTRKSIAEAFELVKAMQDTIGSKDRQLVIYISMGFGNPYGDPYSTDIVFEWIEKFKNLGIQIISIADTLGMAEVIDIDNIFSTVYQEFAGIEIGAHFHALPDEQMMKIDPAYQAGCRRFDTAIGGMGGCPLSGNDLVSNIETEFLIHYLKEHNVDIPMNQTAWNDAKLLSTEIKTYS